MSARAASPARSRRGVRAVLLAGLLAVAVVAAGCTTRTRAEPGTAPAPATRFAGTAPSGVLVAVDFGAFDPVSLRVSRALMAAPRPIALAVVSRVDDRQPVPGPMQLVVTTTEGRMVPLVSASVLLERLGTPAAARARRMLRTPPADRAGTYPLRYLGAADVRTDSIVDVRLTIGDDVIQLQPGR